MTKNLLSGRAARIALRLACTAGLCVAMASPAAAGDTPANPATPADIVEVVARLNGQRLLGECHARLVPAAALIMAGVPAEGLKPATVQEQLDRQIAAIDKLIAEHHGTVRHLERLRALRGNAGEQAQKAPFMALQRLAIELPVTAPLDAILDKLLLLGVDRFGSDLRLDGGGGGARLAVLYRFDRLPERVEEIRDQCRQEAFRAWCEQRPEVSGSAGALRGAACPALLLSLKDYFRNESFRLNGLSAVTSDGRVSPQSLSLPAQATAWEEIRAGSPDPVEVSGDFATTFELRPR